MISILVLDISNVTNLLFDWLVFVINSNRSKIFAGRTGKEKNIKIFFLITKLAPSCSARKSIVTIFALLTLSQLLKRKSIDSDLFLMQIRSSRPEKSIEKRIFYSQCKLEAAVQRYP